MKSLWYIGNTSVRSPLRLRDGIIALLNAPYLQGNIRGGAGDNAFRELLGREGIVSLGDDSTKSVGRKWRAALCKLGFLYPDISKDEISQKQLGPMDYVTPNGHRLAQAQTVPAMQECFLRAFVAQFIEYPINDKKKGFFSPFLYVLSIMLALEKETQSSAISFPELAAIIQLSNPSIPISNTVQDVIDLRKKLEISKNKRQFINKLYKETAAEINIVDHTLRDYADANIRYLKASGILQGKGRGIIIIPEKHLLVELITNNSSLPDSLLEKYRLLCKGAGLPTDEGQSALNVLKDSIKMLQEENIDFDLSQYELETPAGISIAQHDIDDLILKRKEENYAKKQVEQWDEILQYIDLIIDNKKKSQVGNGVFIPRSECAAYLEWIIWRAFLAINSLVNKPYNARRFNVDQDFLPVSTAPGNGPDLIMEFSNYSLVVEVTLMDSSRQEAAEGEPVRRHVASIALQSEKPVLCLFIANHIDSNTAETFRNGVWFTKEDSKLLLNIVPMELVQFKDIFNALFTSGRVDNQLIRNLLEKCRNRRMEEEAPGWKKIIQNEVSSFVDNLKKTTDGE